MRPTAREIAAAAAAEMKEARKIAQSGGPAFNWERIETIIATCIERADQPPAKVESNVEEVTVTAIYATYPRHVGRDAAFKAIGKAAMRMKDKEPNALLYLLERTKLFSAAVSLWSEEDRKFIPHPATWYNQGRYDDNPREWERGSPKAATTRNYAKL